MLTKRCRGVIINIGFVIRFNIVIEKNRRITMDNKNEQNTEIVNSSGKKEKFVHRAKDSLVDSSLKLIIKLKDIFDSDPVIRGEEKGSVNTPAVMKRFLQKSIIERLDRKIEEQEKANPLLVFVSNRMKQKEKISKMIDAAVLSKVDNVMNKVDERTDGEKLSLRFWVNALYEDLIEDGDIETLSSAKFNTVPDKGTGTGKENIMNRLSAENWKGRVDRSKYTVRDRNDVEKLKALAEKCRER